MLLNAKMRVYRRMYWGDKIPEWAETPEDAYRIALHLNNNYELDGRNPNGLVGVTWCFGKQGPPAGRPIFGKIRYMNAKGLSRKSDAPRYVEKIETLTPRY